MYGMLDRLFWVNKNDVDVGDIRIKNTAITSGYSGGKVIELFEEKEDSIGVPRNWGIQNLKCPFVDATTYPKLIWPAFQWPDGWDWRMGQQEAVAAILRRFKDNLGVCLEAACGFGKTLVALKVAEALQTSALVLVHRTELARQWVNSIKYGYVDTDGKKIAPFWPDIKLGFVKEDILDYKNSHVTVGMVQTIHSRKDNLPEDFWKNFGILLVEEAHLYPADSLEGVLRLVHAKYRLGFSATWRRKDGLESIWRHHISDDIYAPKTPRATGEYFQFYWPTKFTDDDAIDFIGWVEIITTSDKFNDWIVDQMIASSNAGRRMLVASMRREHCLNLKALFDRKVAALNAHDRYNAKIFMGNGRDFKMSALDKLQARQAQNIIATTQMVSVGVDIPSFDTLVLASPFSDVEQLLGRVSRIKEGKKKLLIVDPIFKSGFNMALGNKRRSWYKKLGFERQKIEQEQQKQLV